MAARYLVLLAVPALQGCITNALWYKEEVPPELHAVSVPCEVLEVTTSARTDDPSIRVSFSAQPVSGAPKHLTRFDSDRPGVFELKPNITDVDWRKIPGAELFAPSSWDLNITSGTYFSRVPANAELEFFGLMHPGDLGELVPSEQLPPAMLLRDEFPIEHLRLWEYLCLEAFQTHDWMELLSPTGAPTGYRPEPLAWVDGNLNAIETIAPSRSGSVSEDDEEIRARLRGLRLLARLKDSSAEEHYALIAVPALLQGTDLHMQRVGDSVQWSRSQIWTASLHAEAPDAGDWNPLPIPLRGQRFDYRWFSEVEQDELPLLDSLRVLATPITALLDFVIMTNGPLSRLAKYLSGEDEQAAPVESKTDR